jgi:hypothetical protein
VVVVVVSGESLTGSQTSRPSLSSSLWARAACSPGEKRRKGRKAETRPVTGALNLGVSYVLDGITSFR